MISGSELRTVRRSAGIGLTEMATRTLYSKCYLGLVETGRRGVTDEVVAAYERALGVGLHDGEVNRREFFGQAAIAATNATVVRELGASLAGGDSGPLALIQTSHAVDQAIAAAVDGPVLRRLRAWSIGDGSGIVRVNAIGIIAKAPSQSMAHHVVDVLEHDHEVRTRYLTAVIARVCAIDRKTARGFAFQPLLLPAPQLAAKRFATEAFNSHDAGARWCSATMLARLSPVVGR